MADPIKALTAAGKGGLDFVAALLITTGGLLVIGSCIYRVFVCPEWTFEQARQALWPFVAAGAVSLMFGWLLDRAER